jgi:hypothetical protein
MRLQPQSAVRRILDWYFQDVYGAREGPGTVPFYCDKHRVGWFAVPADELAAGRPEALFGLFVALAMFQARRDVVIMKQQRAMPAQRVAGLVGSSVLEGVIEGHQCPWLATSELFDSNCDVMKSGKMVDCVSFPGARCHVKQATTDLRRTGDMGKLPTSAWLHVWKHGGPGRLLEEVFEATSSPQTRGTLLVERFSRVYRVGRKLATMFVSALSTPALAPGLSPWFPEVDGNELVVVDTNVTHAIDALCGHPGPRSYGAQEKWIRDLAAQVDLRKLSSAGVPDYSPRLVQQALYAFFSKSNRATYRESCAKARRSCRGCLPTLCPVSPGSAGPREVD